MKTDTFTHHKIRVMLPYIKDGAKQSKQGTEPKIKELLAEANSHNDQDEVVSNTALSNLIKIYMELPEAINSWCKGEDFITAKGTRVNVKDASLFYSILPSKGNTQKSSLTALKKEAKNVGLSLTEYVTRLDQADIRTTKDFLNEFNTRPIQVKKALQTLKTR